MDMNLGHTATSAFLEKPAQTLLCRICGDNIGCLLPRITGGPWATLTMCFYLNILLPHEVPQNWVPCHYSYSLHVFFRFPFCFNSQEMWIRWRMKHPRGAPNGSWVNVGLIEASFVSSLRFGFYWKGISLCLFLPQFPECWDYWPVFHRSTLP